jgi:hypothetical protein
MCSTHSLEVFTTLKEQGSFVSGKEAVWVFGRRHLITPQEQFAGKA